MSKIESYAAGDDEVALSIDGRTTDMPTLTVEQARALAADLIETCDYIARTTAEDQAAQA